MQSVHKTLSDQFYAWDHQCRGWKVFDVPVHPEPPLQPFAGYSLPIIRDDGKRPSFLKKLIQEWSGKTAETENQNQNQPEEMDETPNSYHSGDLKELQMVFPKDFDCAPKVFEQFLGNLSITKYPITFEVLGTPNKTSIQFITDSSDTGLVRRQLQSHFQDVAIQECSPTLPDAWYDCESDDALIVEFGLGRESLLPLRISNLDFLIGLTGAFSELTDNECAVFQVLFQQVQMPWAEEMIRVVTDGGGKELFVNAPHLHVAAKEKSRKPLYAAVVRLGIRSNLPERTLEIARDAASCLSLFSNPGGNELIPLHNAKYPFNDHENDLILHQSHRTGMILTSEELVQFVHFPGPEVRSPKLLRSVRKTKTPPKSVIHQDGYLLGSNIHVGKVTEARLTTDQRCNHTHIIGVSGTGKSTLLYHLIRQDIERGEGVAVLDPHGDLIDKLLGVIPESRVNDVVLVDPSDTSFPIGFNILSAHTELEKSLLASDLVSVFQRLSTAWGDQMGSVLQNAILAFVESERGGSIADLRRFLLEPKYRSEFLSTVKDPDIVYYWKKGFPQLTGNKSIGPILTRLDTFLAQKMVRSMVSQRENKINFQDIMDTRKIFLAKLSQGLIGNANAYLLGSCFISKIQQTAMGRQAQEAEVRQPFWCYVDEFHNFITPSMAEILTGARKYRLGLILAHQELRQMQVDTDVSGAVMSNSFTRICFRVGDDDARKLAHGFSAFIDKDLMGLEKGQAICRIERSDCDFNLDVAAPAKIDVEELKRRKSQVINASRSQYGNPDWQIESISEDEVEDQSGNGDSNEDPFPPQKEQRANKGVEKPKVETSHKIDSTVSNKLSETPTLQDKLSTASSAVEESKTEQHQHAETQNTELGRGGAQHKILQERLQAAARDFGFMAKIEAQLADNMCCVDLLLTREGEDPIACEISITTSIDHEIGNARKCLKAGFNRIVMIAVEEIRLSKFKSSVANTFGQEVLSKFFFFLPDQFIEFLKQMPVGPAKKQNEERKFKGRKITRTLVDMSEEDRRKKEEAAIKAIADSMKTKKK